jgi:hypothetical protein
MGRIFVFAAIFVVGIVALPAAASTPVATTIVIDTTIPPEGPPTFGPFTATGGVVCPSGDTIDVVNHGAGFQSGSRLQLRVVKRFTCADGSGTFDLLFRVHIVFDPGADFTSWSVLSGTGDYEHLHGSGKLDGLATPTGVLDTLTGRLHID